ncbi:MAG TPA: spermidine synthase [Thermoanaerobaculia bacterium]|jgi:spermidine synthase
MIPWTLLGTATIPGDGGEMRLYQRGTEFSIRVGGYELMNSRAHGSEDALAELVCKEIGGRGRVLIGGLGMAFTLNAMLQCVTAGSEVIVAELVPEVVEWHRGPLRVISGTALDDPRVRVETADVAAVIRAGQYDAIVLDVDNGPAGLTSKNNDWLYGTEGLKVIQAALHPGGVLAVWSSGPDAAFTRRLHRVGFQSEEVIVRSSGGKGPRYLIWVARRPPAARS